MLDVILQILSVIGTILLVLLILALVLLLLILFFPITYKFWGTKQEELVLKAQANWLFGLLRVRYAYPEPGKLTVKALWFTLYEAVIPGVKKDDNAQIDADASNGTTTKAVESGVQKKMEASKPVVMEDIDEKSGEEQEQEHISDEKILKKIEQIKYTILNICDKIKEIWENINYYVELFRDESSKELFRHVFLRVGKILKSIRPRHLKGDIIFGTGSPDTTGYAYAAYGMLSTVLGPKFIVTPDFEQSILKGELQFSGHITIWVILINGLKLLFDRKLHRFIKKVKAGLPKKNADTKQSDHNQNSANSAERGK